ncbi:MAG: hypothetical protein RLZZ01_1248, partial [Actinomycetota bacterium]
MTPDDRTDQTMERRTPLRRLRAVALGGLVVLGLSACAQNAPQDTWDPAGDNAQQIHDLQWPVFAVAGIVGLIVMAAVAYCVFRFRDRGQPIPEQTHGKAWLEYLFIAIPAAILVGVGVPTVSVVLALNETDDTECVVNVTGQQWWWEYDYPVDADGMICGEYQHTNGETLPIITSGQMVIPTDTNVLIRGTSRDVIHSFWVPRLNGKRDMVPGRVHTWRFQAWEPGIYAGQCAEFCGLSHANMRMEIVALDPPDFQKLLDNQLEPYQAPEAGTLAATGEATFVSQCSRCHQVDGLTDANGDLVVSAPDQFVWSGVAPNLTNLMTRNTFAGATWDLVTEACRNDIWEAAPEEFGAKYLEGVSADCLNEIDLKEWLRNAPAKKPMYADADKL